MAEQRAHTISRRGWSSTSSSNTPIRPRYASVGSYDHSTGAYTWRTGDGLVNHIDRVASGDLTGFVESVRHSKGYDSATPSNTSKYYDVSVAYLSSGGTETVGGFVIVNPLLASVTSFATEATSGTGGDTVSFAYTFHSGATLAIETRTTTYPKVPVAQNGRGNDTSDPVVESKAYFDANGDVRFVRSLAESTDPIYRITYVAYTPPTGELDDGQPRLLVEDAYTGILTGVPTGFASQSGVSTFHRPTSFEYDLQGKRKAVVAPGSRRSEVTYLRMKDHRVLTIRVPRVKGGAYYTPASATLYNHAGVAEEWGQVTAAVGTDSLGIGTTTTVPTAWKTSDVLTLFEMFNSYSSTAGTRYLSALSEATFDQSGSRLQSVKRYFDIYDRFAPTSSTYQSDSTFVGYDDAARLVRVQSPAGTISATTYDALGRPIAVSRGTNDGPGTSNMKTVTELSYDDNASTGYGGNSNATQIELHLNATTSRSYELIYDYRNRPWALNAPLSPHFMFKYDNLGRVVAAGMYQQPLSATGTPPDLTGSTSTDRLALRESAFDTRGQSYRDTRWRSTLPPARRAARSPPTGGSTPRATCS